MNIGTRVTGHLENAPDGRVEFNGTVCDTYSSNGRTVVVVVADDGTEYFAPEDKVAPERMNIATHTGKVHASGAYYKVLRGRAPKCCASASAAASAKYHYLIPTADPVDCLKCLNLLAKEKSRVRRQARG